MTDTHTSHIYDRHSKHCRGQTVQAAVMASSMTCLQRATQYSCCRPYPAPAESVFFLHLHSTPAAVAAAVASAPPEAVANLAMVMLVSEHRVYKLAASYPQVCGA